MCSDGPDSLFSQGLVAAKEGRHDVALTFFTQASAGYEASPDRDLPTAREKRADCTMKIAITLKRLNRHYEAIEQYNRALAEYRRLPRTELKIANGTMNLAIARRGIGLLKDAERGYLEALSLYAQIPGTDREQAKCRVNLAASLRRQGRYVEAAELYHRSLRDYEILPKIGLQRPTCIMNLAITLRALGRFSQAEKFYRQAMDLYRQLPHTERQQAKCFMNLAVTLRMLGKHDEANTCLDHALHAYTGIPGSERQQANCLTNKGRNFEALNDLQKADNLFQQALHIYQRLDGADHETLQCLVNLARIRRKERNFGKAAMYLAAARKLCHVVETHNARGKIDVEEARLLRDIASQHEENTVALLRRALRLALPHALSMEEKRYLLPNKEQRKAWMTSVASPHMGLVLQLAQILGDNELIGELTAKWRLSGSLENRGFERPLDHIFHDQNKGMDERAEESDVEDTGDDEVLSPSSTLAGADTTASEMLRVHRTPGPLLNLPYRHRSTLEPYIDDSSERPHARYK